MSRREAFEFLAGLLSLDDRPAERDSLRHRLQSVSWPDVVAIASEHWVSAAVWPALRRRSLHDDPPAEARDYFEGMATLNRQRNARLRSEAIELARTLNRLGVIPIFLKGGANLLAGLYPDPAIRIMVDLDVLLPACEAPECVRILQENGYRQLGEAGFPDHHHYPSMARPAAAGSIEVHVEPVDIQYQRYLTSADIFSNADQVTVEGARFAIPVGWCRLVHCIVHAQFADHEFVYGRLPLRDLLDSALLTRSEPISIEAIAARFPTPIARTVLASHLGATRRLGGDIPGRGAPSWVEGVLYRRALFHVAHPRISGWMESLLRPWLLLRRSLSHAALRRRLFKCLVDGGWYSRQWHMFRHGHR